MATINSSQDYDLICTLTLSSAGTVPIRLYRGSASAYSGTVYYRAGTGGAWTSLSVSGTSTVVPNLSSTTIQVGMNWNKSGNDYMTPSFINSGLITTISMSQKAVLSGTIGNYFFNIFAEHCVALTSFDVPDTSGVTTIGNYFMYYYVEASTAITSLNVPDTSSVTTIGTYFLDSYADSCTSLISSSVPDISNVTTVGNNFMNWYTAGCTSLLKGYLPDTSSLSSVGSSFMSYFFVSNNTLMYLYLPDSTGWFGNNNINLSIPSGRLGYLSGYVNNATAKTDWNALTVSGYTLYTNYIRNSSYVKSIANNSGNMLLMF